MLLEEEAEVENRFAQYLLWSARQILYQWE